jgi:hypothetical protein
VRRSELIVQFLFYSLVFALLLSRAVSAGVSHDENQFIAAGQMLADRGLLPYRDYPYAHMPYAVGLYALTAKVSSYDYLAARLLGASTWLACIALIVAIVRLISRSFSSPSQAGNSFASIFVEFGTVLLFLYAPISSYVLGAALNHSFATAFSLLAFFFFLRGTTQLGSLRTSAFWSGISISLAAFIRFNFASLALILFALWLVSGLTVERHRLSAIMPFFFIGAAIAALPAIGAFALAPAGFYFANIVFIRLNTLYYEGILFRHDMDLPSKIGSFLGGISHARIELGLYTIGLIAGLAFLIRFARSRSPRDLAGLASAGFAGTLFLTAFTPTPTQEHYFFAPLPYLLILVFCAGWLAYRWSRHAHVLLTSSLLLALLASTQIPSPVGELAGLLRPSEWRPMQVHSFSESLKAYVPAGRILTLFPVIPMEAGYEIYAFTTAGPFPWRTSLLLTAERRSHYGVISPQELEPLLLAAPPAGILTGFETPNAGFTFGDLGGLEQPFINYAERHGYTPVPLSPEFIQHQVILWVRQP